MVCEGQVKRGTLGQGWTLLQPPELSFGPSSPICRSDCAWNGLELTVKILFSFYIEDKMYLISGVHS